MTSPAGGVRILFVPSAPFLLLDAAPAELASAVKDGLEELEGEVVVVGSAPAPGWWEGSVDLTPYGVPGTPARDPLPLALAVGAHLLRDRPYRLWGVPSGPLPDARRYLVVADGTARRGLRSPGHHDDRAEGFDAALTAAVLAGSPERLQALDEGLAEELWVQGMPALRAVASLPGPWRGRVSYADAPHGVGYVVGTWTR